MSEPSHPAGMPAQHQDLILSLQRRIDEVLHPLVPADRPVALLDFPVYRNVGDSAIWLGAIASLRRRGIHTLRYACSFKTYSRRELARRIGDGTILLSGGGNFGDLYPPHQRLREDVIAGFPAHRIIQLPQSISFRTREALERSRQVITAHPRLTLLMRDHRSLELAGREYAGVPSQLCPDTSLALGVLRPVRLPSDRIVWLSRTDSESLATTPRSTPAGVERVDWIGVPRTALDDLGDRVHRRIRSHPRVMRWLYGSIARRRLHRGIHLLSGARCVITDRLHGHILCMQLGIRHFLLPSSTGKVRAFFETWTHPSPLVRWCDDESEALQLALAEPPEAIRRQPRPGRAPRR